jgi:plasmid stabilization system protein ParE
MVKQVIWSLKAHHDRKQILDYWRARNKSNTYSEKLNSLFKEAIRIITDFPKIGKPTDIENVRIKIVRDYFIFYEEGEQYIYI